MPAAAAVLTATPFVFPSLGPSAYQLTTDGRAERISGRTVVVGHLTGVVGGVICHAVLADGLVVTAIGDQGGLARVRLVVSGVVSVVGTALGMMLVDSRHSPACATTLIVSLGLLPPVTDGVVVVGSVVALYLVYLAGERIGDGPDR